MVVCVSVVVYGIIIIISDLKSTSNRFYFK